METQILNPLDDPQWETLISTHPQARFFHGAAWARVLHQTYGHRPLYLRFVQDRQTVALLPMMEVHSVLTGRRGVGLPFTDSCAPLVFDEMVARAILAENLRMLGQERRWQHFEVRGRGGTPDDATSATAFYGHELDLQGGAEKLFAGFSSAVRRAIRKAERSDLCARIADTAEAMHDFYRLHVRTRRRHGAPPQPFSFFQHIWREVIRPGLGFIALATRQARAVAAGVFFCRAGRAVYKFGASARDEQELRPNNLVMWHAIRHLADQGAASLHFGRTSLHHEGLRRFKLAWGAREETLEYFQFDLSRAAWTTARDKASGLHTAVFRRLPLTLNRFAGAMLYPHLD